MAEWSKVAGCEEGGWIGYSGVAFPDSIGQTSANWFEFAAVAGINPSDLSPEAQSLEGNAFSNHYGILPDQNGCGGGY